VRHIDPDLIALAALGEPLGAADRDHLAECGDCARELAALTTAAAVARAGGEEQLVPAPDAVWERIRGELGLSAGLEPGTPAAVAAPVGPVVSGGPVVPEAAGDPPPVRAAGRRRRGGWLAAAAAGLVVGGVAGGLVVDTLRDRSQEEVLAEARLAALPGWDATGDAVVEETPDGQRTLVVRLTGGEFDGYREVWLLDRDATRLVGLGLLDGDEGRFTLPAGLDLDDYAVVDVSAEPIDGDPGHSGDSILRGELSAPA
jgi:hypothetical protein